VSKSLQSQMHSDANKIGKLEKRAKRLEDIIQQSHQAWSTYVQQIRAKFLQDQKSYQEVVQQAQMDLQQVQSELQQQKLHTYQSLSQTLVPGPCFSAAASLQSGMEVDAEPLLPWMSPGVLDFPSGPPPSMDSLSGVPAVAGLQVPVSQPAKDSAQPPFLHHSFHVTPGLQSEPAGFPCAATPPAANPMFANGLSQVAASHGGLPCGGFPCGGLPCVPGPSAFPFVSAAVSQAPPVTVPSAPVAQEASTESAPKRYQETPSTAATSTPPCQPVHPLDFVGETSMLLQQAGFMVAQATNQEQHAMATQALHAAHVLHQQAQQALAPGCAPCHPVSDPVLQSLVSRVQEVKAMQQQGMELFKQFQSSQPRVPPGSVGVPVPPLSPASANRPVETPVHDVQSISSSPEKPASLHQRLPKVSKACEGSVLIQPGAVFHELGGMDTPPDIPSPVPTLVPTEIASPREEDLTALG
jgi:hypothetical protein